MSNDAHRTIARASFDNVAALYDEARPGYPEALYDDLIALAKLAPSARLLEIGAGTGHATEPLAQRGFRIDAIELGENMAAAARQRLAAFRDVTITVADFDRWQTNTRYPLVYSASAYHWLDPATRVAHTASLLESGGSIAVFRNHHVQREESAAFNAAVGQTYAHVLGEQRATRGLPRPEDIAPTEAVEWRAGGLFGAAATRVYRWRQVLTAEAYVRMLNTHSDHRLLTSKKRTQLFDELRRLIDREFGGVAVKEYVTLLQIAQKSA